MIVGVINIVLGILLASFGIYSVLMDCRAPFWLGGMVNSISFFSIINNKVSLKVLL